MTIRNARLKDLTITWEKQGERQSMKGENLARLLEATLYAASGWESLLDDAGAIAMELRGLASLIGLSYETLDKGSLVADENVMFFIASTLHALAGRVVALESPSCDFRVTTQEAPSSSGA